MRPKENLAEPRLLASQTAGPGTPKPATSQITNLRRGDASASSQPHGPAEAPTLHPVEVEAAVQALRQYQAGADRGALMPIEDWIARSAIDQKSRVGAEAFLLGMLAQDVPMLAKEFVCNQLLLVASSSAVPALARLLEEPALVTAACTTLASIPGPEVAMALRTRLSRLKGNARAMVIQTIGLRKDVYSLPMLERILRTNDILCASAAARALGHIGTSRAASALESVLRNGPADMMDTIADACLECADRLASLGHSREAARICRSVASCGRASARHQALAEKRAAKGKYR